MGRVAVHRAEGGEAGGKAGSSGSGSGNTASSTEESTTSAARSDQARRTRRAGPFQQPAGRLRRTASQRAARRARSRPAARSRLIAMLVRPGTAVSPPPMCFSL